MQNSQKPKPGNKVVLLESPAALLSGLPDEDQSAIRDIVGKPVLLEEYDEDGRAVLRFTDAAHVIHFIFVKPDLIREIA